METTIQSVTNDYELLCAFRDSHDFWDNDLFKACRQGRLTREDFRYVFSQYYLYCKNFTRYITGVMTNCENDLQRAHLSENLWEEAGEKEPEKRHAEIFRKFLTEVLGVELGAIRYESFAWQFMNSYLRESQNPDIVHGTAFLSLGTEGLVAEMYKVFVEGLLKAGISNDDLLFFHLHIGCDDEHALTLENMLRSYRNRPNWFETAKEAVDRALCLRRDFFNSLYKEMYLKKLNPIISGITGGHSLSADAGDLVHAPSGQALYRNQDEAQGIDFSVERLTAPAQVLDPRIVHIPAGKANESHEHAHETFIYVISGKGLVHIDDRSYEVHTGASVLVPRWSKHQTVNTSDTEPLIYLGVTDYNLTKNFPGNTEQSYRKVPKQVTA